MSDSDSDYSQRIEHTQGIANEPEVDKRSVIYSLKSLDQEIDSLKNCIKTAIDSSVLSSLDLKESMGNSTDKNVTTQYSDLLKTHLEQYNKSSDHSKYGKLDWYKDYKSQLWEITNFGEPMPQIFDDGDSDSDEDIVVQSMTTNFKCPLTTKIFESPMTSYGV
ncbi:hypothetical protein AYI70_g5602 [Smittium culicis]|uniref:Uncharacterized protein n=1 Tax=Smittium culicis TaxID=133412 RepID=A0A1R1XTT9_9FUNG|nr:hypothetical protein AYI70_g5602 [Smittium culicis]